MSRPGWHSTASAGSSTAEPPPFMCDPRRRCVGVDPDLFFVTDVAKQRAVARRYCDKCPIVATCRRWAVRTGQQDGIWGGLTTKQLRAAVRRAGPPPSRGDQ